MGTPMEKVGVIGHSGFYHLDMRGKGQCTGEKRDSH